MEKSYKMQQKDSDYKLHFILGWTSGLALIQEHPVTIPANFEDISSFLKDFGDFTFITPLDFKDLLLCL